MISEFPLTMRLFQASPCQLSLQEIAKIQGSCKQFSNVIYNAEQNICQHREFQTITTRKKYSHNNQFINIARTKITIKLSNLIPPICSEIQPAELSFASILAAAMPWPLPLTRF